MQVVVRATGAVFPDVPGYPDAADAPDGVDAQDGLVCLDCWP